MTSRERALIGPFAWPSGRAQAEAVAIAGAVSRTIVKLGCDGRHVSVRARLIQQRARLTRRKNRWCEQCQRCEASYRGPSTTHGCSARLRGNCTCCRQMNAVSPGTFLPRAKCSAPQRRMLRPERSLLERGPRYRVSKSDRRQLFLCAVWQQMSPDAVGGCRRLFV